MAVKQVNHINIVVSDMERSLAFYVGLLQMRVTFEVHLQGEWIEQVVGMANVSARCVFCQPAGGGARFELLQYISPEGFPYSANSLANTPGLRHIALEVDDIEETYNTLINAGITTLSAPVVVPFSLVDGIQKSLCYLLDPDGVIVEICQHIRS